MVLLSLVRSNVQGAAGFVNIQNRVCVALSRAKHGMYVIGNFTMLAANNELWQKICEDVKSRGRLGQAVELQCPNHVDSTKVEARYASDFDRCPNGGCTRICNTKMKCGHTCMLLCHPLSHEFIRCNQKCLKPRPPNCPHPCAKVCWQDCGPCLRPVEKFRAFCQHAIRVNCSDNVDEVVCTALCGVMMLCGHTCPDKYDNSFI